MVNILINYVKELFPNISKNDHQNRNLKLLSVNVIEPDNYDYGELIKLGKSYIITIQFNYQVLDSAGNQLTNDTAEIRIPKVINGSYIIEGQVRTNESILINDDLIRIQSDRVTMSSECVIFKIKAPYSDVVIDQLVKYVDDNGEWQEFWLSKTPIPTNVNSFKLNHHQMNKIKIKLNIDSIPDYITEDLIKRLLVLPNDSKSDNIIDKKISSIAEDLLTSLVKSKDKYEKLSQLQKNFRRHSKVYLTPVQSKIDSYFKGGADSRVRFNTQINPLAIDSMSYKIKIPTQIAYNKTFRDIIDPINTPENTSINVSNELNVCVDLSKGSLSIFCLDFKTHEKVSVDYLDYLNSKVLSNKYFDYDDNLVIFSKEYEYDLRQVTYKTTDLNDIMYIEPKPDDKLSLTTRQLPFINSSDPSRVRMGAGMAKQAVEVLGHEPRLISTGNEDEDYKRHTMTTFYKEVEGVVDSIEENKITILNQDGSKISYTIPDKLIGLNASVTSYETPLKVGDIIKKDEPIITTKIQKSKQYEVGVNTRLAYMFYGGYVYEDAVVVSKSYARKMSYYSHLDVELDLGPEDIITYMNSVGEKVKSLDNLVGYRKKIDNPATSAYQNKKSPLSFLNLTHIESNLVVPNNINEAYIIDMRIRKSGAKDMLVDSESDAFIDTYLGHNLKPGDISSTLINTGIHKLPKNLPTADTKNYIEDYKSKDGYKYSIKIRLLVYHELKEASKLTNTWGSKGEVSLVLEDDMMPYTGVIGTDSYRAVDMIISPNSVMARMNLSQLLEILLTKCVKATHKAVTELLSQSRDEEALVLVKKYYKQHKNLTVEQLKSLVDNKGLHAFNLKVGSFSTYKPQFILEWASDFNLSETEYITIPGIGEVETPQLIGDSYIMRLYHNGDASAKVTSTVRTKGAPLLGKGQYRDDGQKMGEMENWVADGMDIYKLVIDQSKDYLLNQHVFLNHMMLAGFLVTDSFGTPIISPEFKKTRRLVHRLDNQKIMNNIDIEKYDKLEN